MFRLKCDDVLGDMAPSGAIDLSDAGLESRVIEDSPVEDDVSDDEVDDEPESVDDADESDDDDAAGDADDEEGDSPAEAEADPDPDPADDIPEKLRGKSQAELAKMFLDLEKHVGSKSGELGELRQMTQAQAAQLAQLQAAMQAQQAAQHGGDLVELVRQNPVGIYNQAMSALDAGQVDVTVIDDIIEEVEAHAEELAEEGQADLARNARKLARSMQRDFDRRIVLAEQQARQAPIEQQVTLATKQSAYQGGVKAYFNLEDPDDKADAEIYRQDVTNLLKGKDLGNTPEQVKANLVGALRYVRGMNPGKSSAFRRAQGQVKAAASSQAPSGDKTEKQLSSEESARQAIFANKKKNPADDLFSSKNFMAGKA